MAAGEILELNTFLAVAEEGRFARAAIRLGVTPSAVSQSVRRLETRLCVRLFTRTTRAVALTEAGEILLLEVKPALDRLARAGAGLAHLSAPAGRARLSVSAVAMELLVAPILPDFRRDHPDFLLEVFVDDKIADPVTQRFDAVIRRGHLLQQDMIARRLSEDDAMVLAASPRYLASLGPLAHPRELRGRRIVVSRPRYGATLPWLLARRGETAKIDGGVGITADSALAARNYALEGLGVGFFAQAFVADALRTGRLRRVLPDWSWPISGFHLMYVDPGLAPALRELERAMAGVADGGRYRALRSDDRSLGA